MVIDDGSVDGTARVVKELIKKNPRIRLIAHEINKGYGAALKSGLYSAKYDLIAYNDGDGQFSFDEIKNFLPLIKECDLVIGYRSKRQDPFIRRLNGKTFNLVVDLLFGLTLRDVDCAFKLIKKKVIETIPSLISNGAMVSTELLYKSQKEGFKICEIPVTHYPRLKGKPTGGSWRVIFRAMGELLKLRLKLR